MAHGSVGGGQGWHSWWLCCSGCASFSSRVKVRVLVLLGCGLGCLSQVPCKFLGLRALRGLRFLCFTEAGGIYWAAGVSLLCIPREVWGQLGNSPSVPCWGFLWLCFSAACFRLSKPEFNPLDIKALKCVCVFVCTDLVVYLYMHRNLGVSRCKCTPCLRFFLFTLLQHCNEWKILYLPVKYQAISCFPELDISSKDKVIYLFILPF